MKRTPHLFGMTKGSIGVSASKEGYHMTLHQHKQPVVVELRRQLNLIPMYAKDAKIDLPSGDGTMPMISLSVI